MKVGFYVPPAHQRLGGLDQAILSLQQHLDCSVELEPKDPSACDLIHFHGLWQPRFRALAFGANLSQFPTLYRHTAC